MNVPCKFAFSVLSLAFLLVACSESQVEELVFRKTVEHDLVELCEEDEECVTTVETQIKACMEKSDWRSYLEDQDNPTELKRFAAEFYPCFADSEGSPYFESNL